MAADPEDTEATASAAPRPDGDQATASLAPGWRVDNDATASLPSTPILIDEPVAPGTKVGRYLVVDRVGAGGMGVVYRAFDPELDRKVAIKIIRPAQSGSMGRARMQREAQALARLSHPNIVAVFDVGIHDGQVFLAMEYIEGQTLREWLAATKRPLRAILEVFIAAGVGLHAAHQAGIIHRDFKPANVLVAVDGRVRILDFGIARLANDPEPSEESLAILPDEPSSGSALATPLTEAGAAVGTPAYMAPEQHRGASTALVDQYAFCVSLYEAVHGQRPGKDRAPAAGVPRWLERVLARGLSSSPSARFPSVAALVAELRVHTAGRRWLPWAAATATAAAAAAVLVVGRGGAAPVNRCRIDDAPIEEMWNDDSQAAVRAAFLRTGQRNAGAIFERVRGQIDARLGSWRRLRVDACEDTWVRGEQSQELLDRRVRCLDRGLAQLGALVTVFRAGADAQMLRDAPKAALELGSLDDCSNPELLGSLPPPATSEGRLQADELEHRLDAAAAQRAAGKLRDALAAVRAALPDIEHLGYLPLRARALLQLGILESETGDHAGGVKSMQQAGELAGAAGDDATLARAWTELIAMVGYRLAKYDEADAITPMAKAAVARVGSPPLLQARLENNTGVVLLGRGDYAGSRAAFERALVLRRSVLPPGDLQVALAIENVAIAQGMMGDFAAASESHAQALAIKQELLGPDHLAVGQSLNNYGEVLRQKGDVAAALDAYQRALAIFEATFAPGHVYITTVLDNIGMAQRQRRDYRGAIATYQRLLAIAEAAAPEGNPDVARILDNYGGVLLDEHRDRDAAPYVERALAMRRKAFAGDHPDLVESLLHVGALTRDQRGCAAAIPRFEEALAMAERVVGAQHPLVGSAVHELGGCALAQDRPSAAVPLLERALAIREHAGAPSYERAATELLLAHALRASGGDRSRAARLVTAAAHDYQISDGYAEEAQAAAAER